ncbi:MAG: hypothetical protein OXC62_15205 [Aestuariivita sp.]|nr:hypothetical protein [Aestuariivita sp.]
MQFYTILGETLHCTVLFTQDGVGRKSASVVLPIVRVINNVAGLHALRALVVAFPVVLVK